MEYMCGAKPSVILGLAGSLVAEAKRYCSDVEFVAKDATRGDDGFLSQVVAAALENGATTITLCDTAGTMLPHEFESFVEKLYSEVPALSGAELCVMVSDELSLALASSLSAVTKGASGICVSVNGSAAPSLEAAAHIFRMRGEECSCGLKTTELNRAVKQINWMTRSKKEKNSPFSTGIFTDKESNVKFDKADSITEISEACRKLGYDLSEDDTAKVFKTFRELAEKKTVGVKELEAIIASTAMQVPPAYELVSFVINSGNLFSSTANIIFRRTDKELSGLAQGDGPIDAAFKAIENITGHHYELDDFQIQAVTEGREAMGSALIKLRYNGKLYSGNGLSTDIIGSSISAYLNALNKIAYEESHK